MSDTTFELNDSISIDIGGTFTDCYVSLGDRQASGKAPTTRHRLANGFNAAIADCAEKLGVVAIPLVDADQLVAGTDIVRYATTLAMNALIERKGPRLGLITTAGFEDTTLIGRGAQWHDGMPVEFKRLTARGKRPDPVIPRHLIVGLSERIDDDGAIVVGLNDDQVRDRVRTLVDRGAMGFVVALLQSHRNATHEQRVRDIIVEEFPEVYLGSQPILLSSEVLNKQSEYQRDMTSILAAFLHRTMADELTELGISLHERGYKRPLYIVNSGGGANPLQRTSAVETYNAGPVAGVIGGAHIAEMYGFENIILSDMGGTSFDIGTVVGVGDEDSRGGRHFYSQVPMIDRFRVGITMIETKSIGAGGGSIATFNELLNVVEVGPESAGSSPGPACFGQGGDRPTVTDADLVLGFIDPEYFLGGSFELDREAAEDAIAEHLCPKLDDATVEEAAFLMKTIVDANMGNEVFKETNLKGYDPREFVLFAFGGAGGAHACGYGGYVETKSIMTFPFASVFSAYGIANTDFVQSYERGDAVPLFEPAAGGWLTDYDAFNDVVKALQLRALRDAQDLGAKNVQWSLELQMRYAIQPHTTRIRSPRIFLESDDDVGELYGAFEREYSRVYSSSATYLPGGVEIIGFTLWSTVPTPKIEMPKLKVVGEDASGAKAGSRKTFWGPDVGWLDSTIYRREQLQPGNVVSGPAIVEAVDTTIVLDPDRRMSIDDRGNGVIEKD